MAKVSIITPDHSRSVLLPQGYSGLQEAKAYLDGNSVLHLHLCEIDRDVALRIEHTSIDRVLYVWRGGVKASGHFLDEGSSIIVEHGRTCEINGGDTKSLVLAFSAAVASSQPRAGGHVHLLPVARVQRTDFGRTNGVSGGMHADSQCPTCEVWLHENSFPRQSSVTPEEEARGIHSHSEDEIIFVTDGQIRLGGRLCGPGTALAIAANTLYGFTAGPEGLRFVNFRAGTPGDIRFAHGEPMSEIGLWRDVSHPTYEEV